MWLNQSTYHNYDTDQNQRAAQIGVLEFFGFTVNIVNNLQDELLLKKKRPNEKQTQSLPRTEKKWLIQKEG